MTRGLKEQELKGFERQLNEVTLIDPMTRGLKVGKINLVRFKFV